MRAAIQLLFLLFYVGSSYVTTQHRVVFVVHTLEHSNSRSEDISFDHGKERVRYTHFREAKKIGIDFLFGPASTPRLFSWVSTRHVVTPTVAFKSQFDIETSHSRAPPAQAAV